MKKRPKSRWSGRWVQEARMGGGRLGPETLAEKKWGLPEARASGLSWDLMLQKCQVLG